MPKGIISRRSVVQTGLASLAVGASARSAFPQTFLEIAKLKNPERQAKLIEGAKKEGEIVNYTTLIVNQAVRPLQQGFERKYPFLKYKYIRANSDDLVQRAMSEARAGQTKADVMIGSTPAAMAAADLLDPIFSPELDSYPKEALGHGGRSGWYRSAFYGIGYNTKLIPEADQPKTWEDLLNPRFKGKMVWSSSTETGGSFIIYHLQQVWGKEKGGQFFDKLATQNVALSNASVRALLDLVIAGEYQILISCALHHVIISKGDGAPVWFASPEPVMVRPDYIQLIKGAPHPYAAMLYIDYVLSPEGQEILVKADYLPANPKVEPLPSQRPIVPHLNGKSMKVYAPEMFVPVQAELNDILKKISG